VRAVNEYTGFPLEATPSRSTGTDRRQAPVVLVYSIRCTLAGAWSLAIHRRLALWKRNVWGDVDENAELLRAVNLLVAVLMVPGAPTR